MGSKSDVTPVRTGAMLSQRSDRSIGAIFIDAGKLDWEQAERILHLQRDEGLHFGDAAIKLGLLTAADVQSALSLQFDFPNPGDFGSLSSDLVAACTPSTRQAEAFRAVRTQLMLHWFDGDAARKTLAVVSTERGEGRSFVAANLAVAFSQLGQHTLLIDADMREACHHRLFGIDNRLGLSALLSGRDRPEAIQRIRGLPKLAVLPAGALPPNPAELLSRPTFENLLMELTTSFDVILLDTPPVALSVDAQIISTRTGAVLLVARRNATRISSMQMAAANLGDVKATVVGVVLNDF